MLKSIKSNKRIVSFMLTMVMVLSCFMMFNPTLVKAEVSATAAYAELIGSIQGGSYTSLSTQKGDISFEGSTYKTEDGGYWTYTELWGEDAANISSQAFMSERIDELKQSQKQKFIENVITLANAVAYDCSKGTNLGGVTSETVNVLLEKVQNECGMGSEVLAAVLNDTQPDYTSASKIWKPFSGPISTAIGVLAIAMMALLGLTMALDCAYVVIPAFQMVLDGGEGGESQGNKGGGLGGLVSKAAKDAVKENNNSGGNSDSKSQIGTYFKKRWKELIVIGFCLLYLIQGQIWGLISWLINLVSGILD